MYVNDCCTVYRQLPAALQQDILCFDAYLTTSFHQAASCIDLLSIILLFLRYFNIHIWIGSFHEIF